MSTANAALRNAYILASHAHAANLSLAIGDRVYLNNCIYREDKELVGRNRSPLPLGHSITTTTPNFYNEEALFRGVNDNGDWVVRYAGREYVVPYSFISNRVEDPIKGPKLKLNNAYEAQLVGTDKVQVGCQTFEVAKLRELLTLHDRFAKTVVAPSARPTVHVFSASPRATYVAGPAPVKKVAKKAATKKVAKKTIRSML